MSTERPKPTTIKEFMALAVRGGLVAPEDAQQLIAVLARPDENERVSLRELADRFVTSGILTAWQRRNIMRGRWKGFFLGNYKLLEPLGSGGMSVVYLAEHLDTESHVAIKILPKEKLVNPSNLKRFKIEARAAAMLNHRNIVRAHDLECAEKQHFIVMEYVEGTDLQNYVASHGPLSIAQAVDFLRQATDGLAHAHRAGMVHRDIKPLNLLINIDGELKISDFGLARLLFEDSQTLTVQRNDKILGTADYLAPEQAMDAHGVDGRADIYSLGCTLFFMLAGAPPFNSGNLAARVMLHQTAPPPDLRNIRTDIPPMLWSLLLKTLAKRADDRYQSSEQLLLEVLRIEQSGQLSSDPPAYADEASRVLQTPRRGMESMDVLGLNL